MPITYHYHLFLVRDGGANKHHSIITKTRGVNMMLDVFKAFSRNEDVADEVWAVTLFLDNLSVIPATSFHLACLQTVPPAQ